MARAARARDGGPPAPTSASSLAAIPDLLPFVQLDFPGRLGPDDGRYLIRSAAGEAEHVLVVGGVSGLETGLRRGGGRRGRPRRSSADREAPTVPITRLTVIRPGPFAGGEEAEAWLRTLLDDSERRDTLLEEALQIVNRALHAHHLATQDPHGGGASGASALATRIGFGTGDELADGRFAEAIEVPPAAAPRRRVDALRPQERMAATLGRRETTDACETLLLRASADLAGERLREAALQLRVGLEALLAEVGPDSPVESLKGMAGALADDQAAAQLADLEELAHRRRITGEAANEALAGELSSARAAELAETLSLCERVLRRRRILAQ